MHAVQWWPGAQDDTEWQGLNEGEAMRAEHEAMSRENCDEIFSACTDQQESALGNPQRPPTARQLAVLQAIYDAITERGAPPTLREIGRIVGIRSTNGVTDHLKALERRGLLEKHDAITRGLRLTEAGIALVEGRPVPQGPRARSLTFGSPLMASALRIERDAFRGDNAKLRALLARAYEELARVPKLLEDIRRAVEES